MKKTGLVALFLMIFFAYLFMPGLSLAAACNDGIDNDGDGLTDYPNDPDCLSPTDIAELKSTLAGRYDTPTVAEDVFVSGNYAYVAYSDFGLQILDISNKANPVPVGSYMTTGFRSVYISGSYAYVVGNLGGLRIINISNPAAPYEAGIYNTPDIARGVFFSGIYAYIADGWGGLRIININNPAAPYEAGYCNLPGYARDVYISGSYAYVADDTYGLRIINISNPAAPYQVGYCNTPDSADSVYVIGSYAYVATWNAGLQIINISNPGAPGLAGYYNTPGQAQDVYVSGSYAYVTDGLAGLRIINVSNPASIFEAGYYDTPGDAVGVHVSGSYTYIADGGALRIINISNPGASYQAGYYTTPGSAYGVYVSGNNAYVANGDAGLQIININNIGAPYQAGSYDTPGSASDVYVSGSYAYIADDWALRIINISNPGAPYQAGYDETGDIYGAYISGNYAYITNYFGLDIISIINPGAPFKAGSYGMPFAMGVYVSGSYAYVGDNTGLKIINISNPGTPYLTGYYDMPGYANSIYVIGSYAYTTNESGLQIINISNPEAPYLTGYYNIFLGASGVYVSGSYAYIGALGGLRIINITNPGTPHETGYFDTPNGAANDIYVRGNYAYVANDAAGLVIINVNATDSDGDSLPNWWELSNGCMYVNLVDNLLDFDSDGIDNETEYLNSTDPCPPPSIITVGSGTGTWNYPLATSYHDARTQVIYPASEIGTTGNIRSMALDVTTIPGQVMTNFTIRMKHTSISVYGSNAAWEGTEWTTVYQSNENITSTGWRTFNFTTPFNYNGTDNLLIDISFNNSSNTSDGLCRYSQPGGNRSIYYSTDSEYGDPLNWSGTSNPTPTGGTYVPNIRLTIYPIPQDADGDGLSDSLETTYGTNPNDPDTDHDGLNDYLEAITKPCLDPLVADSDGDGLCDGNVTLPGICIAGEDMNVNGVKDAGETDPCSADTDHDGVNDLQEKQNACMNPLVAQWDADGDALPDNYELAHSLNPCSASDGAADTDGDKISNANEYWNRSRIAIPDPGGFGATGDNRSFWGDSGAGDGVVGPEDISVMRSLVAGDFSGMATLKFYNVIPTSGQTMDLAPDGVFAATDLSILRDMIAGRNCGYVGSMPSALELDISSPPATTVQVGGTTHIGVKVKAQTSGKYMTGASVVFNIDTAASKGRATIFGGDGPAMNHPDYGKYRWDQLGKMTSGAANVDPARVMLRMDAAGTVVIKVYTPQVGISGQGRYMPALTLPDVQIKGMP